MRPISADDSGAALREAVERYRASKPDTAEPPKPAKRPRQWGPISEIPGYPLNDIHGPPPEPPPVRLETAPGGPQLRKVVRDTPRPTTEPTIDPITDMEQSASCKAYHAAVRPLTDDEYALLKEDIAKRGIISPIIKDAAGNIVDGYHRHKIAEELGLTDIPIKQVDGTEVELQAMAIALNVARRQLNAEDRRELVAQLRAEGKSERQIAETLGVTKTTIHRDLEASGPNGPVDLKATGENSPVDRVTGKDGKSRPARMPRKPKAGAEKPKKSGSKENPVSAEPSRPKPQAEPEASGDTLLDSFHKRIPADQVATVQLLWDVLSPSQKQQILAGSQQEAAEAHPSAAPTMGQFEDLWERASRELRNSVSSFVQKKAAEARKRQVEEWAKDANRPAAPAAQNGAATGIATS
jgi:ParB-like chromosome segregation protein Spo0J